MRKQILKLFICVLLVSSCAKNEESDFVSNGESQPVTLSLSSYTVAHFSPLDLFVSPAYAAISDFKFCFKRLRFKRDLPDGLPDTTNDNIDLELGEIVISNTGGVLGTINIPADTYKRIEFDLEPNCGGAGENSVSLINDNGTFNSSDTLTIKFEGVFIVDGEEAIELGVGNIVDAANSYDGLGASIKDALESVSGSI